ncbi:hypothetical protein ABZP36_026765 [Zizania latifolia]
MIGQLPSMTRHLTPDQPLVFALSKRLFFFLFAGTLHHISTVRWGPMPCSLAFCFCKVYSLIMASKMFRAVVVVAAAVTSFAGLALAADEPAPSPTSGAIAVSASLAAAVLCPAAALLFGNLRH